MQKILRILSIFIILGISETFACMPFSPYEVIVGRYENAYQGDNFDTGSGVKKITYINLFGPEHLLNSDISLGKYFYAADSIDMDIYRPGDFLIMIASYTNGDYRQYNYVYETAKISCTSEGTFFIENKKGTIQDWGKKMWQCGHYQPDDVMGEKELLAVIQKKYGNCVGLTKVLQKNNIILKSPLLLVVSFILLGFLYFWKRKLTCKH